MKKTEHELELENQALLRSLEFVRNALVTIHSSLLNYRTVSGVRESPVINGLVNFTSQIADALGAEVQIKENYSSWEQYESQWDAASPNVNRLLDMLKKK